MKETAVTAHLPGLDIEVRRRSLKDGSAEMLLIGLKTTPALDSMGHLLAQPFAVPVLPVVAQSMEVWVGAMQAVWQPWLSLASVFTEALPAKPKLKDEA